MHHWMSKPNWLIDLNAELAKRNHPMRLDFDTHFVLVEEDWLLGYEPEDVAEKIATDTHKRITSFKLQQAQAENLASNG